jgi:hypothetical protein
VLANGSGTYAAPYYTDSISLVFPVPFVEVPILHLQQSPDGQFSPLERVMSLAPYRTTKSAISSVRAVSLTPAGSTQDVIASYIAIGRWHDN